MTRCACRGYLPPAEPAGEPDTSARQLVIEIPEGYQAIVQIVPIYAAPIEPLPPANPSLMNG